MYLCVSCLLSCLEMVEPRVQFTGCVVKFIGDAGKFLHALVVVLRDRVERLYLSEHIGAVQCYLLRVLHAFLVRAFVMFIVSTVLLMLISTL